jgi:hypothetical protein
VVPRSSVGRQQGIACRVAYLRPAAEPTGHPPNENPARFCEVTRTAGSRNDGAPLAQHIGAPDGSCALNWGTHVLGE